MQPQRMWSRAKPQAHKENKVDIIMFSCLNTQISTSFLLKFKTRVLNLHLCRYPQRLFQYALLPSSSDWGNYHRQTQHTEKWLQNMSLSLFYFIYVYFVTEELEKNIDYFLKLMFKESVIDSGSLAPIPSECFQTLILIWRISDIPRSC